MADILNDFVKDCYKIGKGHAEIRAILLESGWARGQIDEVLDRFVDTAYPVAVPKPAPFASPRLVFLNVIYFLVLFLSIFNVGGMLFNFLDYYLPDGLQGIHSFYSFSQFEEAIRTKMAMIACCVPLVWWISRLISKSVYETGQRHLMVRLKGIYFTMFVGVCVMLATAITFIYFFLSGELGLRFILKVLIVTLINIGVFVVYRSELRQAEEVA